MSISVFNVRSITENKPFNGVTDQALRASPVSKHLIIYNVRVSFVTPHPTPSPVSSKAVLLFCLLLVFYFFNFFFFFFFLLHFFSFLSWLVSLLLCLPIVHICLVCDSSIVATCPSIPAARFSFCLSLFVLFLLVVVVLFGEQSRIKGEGWSTAN